MRRFSHRPKSTSLSFMNAMISKPWVEIDLAALCGNFRRLSEATPGAKAAAVVKCDAYGLGLAPVSRALAIKENCHTFFVAYAETGAALRKALADIAPDAEIYIFNGPAADCIDLFKENKLAPILNTLEQASLWAKTYPDASAALHIDTGMNRLGLEAKDIDALKKIDGLNVTMVMSHFACASTPDAPMLAEQQAAFDQITATFPGAKKSLASTGGALISADYGYDLTRLGVGLYGVGPFDGAHDAIEPVASLKAPVLQIRNVKAGASAGYDCTHTFAHDATLATVALGYGDGFPRSGSNSASAFIGGAPCPVVGIVSMDLIILDVTNAPEAVKEGDAAELYGRNLLIEDAASACGTIGYELLTGLGGRIERRYFWGNEPADARLLG